MRLNRTLVWHAEQVSAVALFAFSASAAEPAAKPAGETGNPSAICSVRKEIYVSHPVPGLAPGVETTYVGNGLRRREIHSTEARSDIAATARVRYSEDNGRTWSPFAPMKGSEDLKQNGNGLEQCSFCIHYDSTSGKTVEMLFQRIFLGDVETALRAGFQGDKKFFDHGLYRLSDDNGRSWTQPAQLVYERGAPFNPTNWTDPAYLKANQMYGGYGVITLTDGRLAYPAVVPVRYEEDEEDRKVCVRVPWVDADKGYVPGVMCFFGTWKAQKGDYEWEHSQLVFVPRRVSTRGLAEPALAQLKDGTLMLEMRGSNGHLDPIKYPGRKWISLSKNGGKTWSAVTDLRYDTGEPFYAPASFARMLRSRKTGKLYWVGNISREPPEGNGPRYPLYLAEVDETKAALKKSTVTVIDEHGPTDTTALQLSNFSLLENPETNELEIYLTRYGERPGNIRSADVYKYVLNLLY